ncbi:MAG: LysR family transcriptional regulator [Proteobacteria bacterium]|nr:LysR family transcriptional regulator [Pseudomonadota bacterium]
MLKLDGIVAFVAVAEAGSISEAARRLRLSKSVVSERLAELERSLGATLLHRTTRKLSISEDGLAFHQRASRIVQEVIDATAEISERREALIGPLRISGPVSFGSLHLGPALYRFLKENPGIELTLDLDDRFVNVATAGFDAVVRHGPLGDSRLVAKRLAPSRRVLVASPSYLERYGKPKAVADLEQHRGIVYTNRGTADWRFLGNGRMIVVRPRKSLCVNNGTIMRGAAMAGLGIALLPTFEVYTAVAAGELSVIEVDAEAEGAVIHIAYPKNKRVSAKVRALGDCLRRTFGDPPYWDLKMPSPGAPAARS